MRSIFDNVGNYTRWVRVSGVQLFLTQSKGVQCINLCGDVNLIKSGIIRFVVVVNHVK